MRRRELILQLAGITAAMPFAAHAQQTKLPIVGLLVSGAGTKPQFSDGLSSTGFDDGRNVALDFSSDENQSEQLPALAADLVRRKVAVIAAFGSAAAMAARQATSTIPIVFVAGDPIAEGLVASLARPGSDLTGISLINAELMPKRLELLSDLVPRARSFALLVRPEGAAAEAVRRRTQDAAHARGVELRVLRVSDNYGEIDNAFDDLHRLHVEALIVDPESFLGGWYIYIVTLASRHAIPAIYGNSLYTWGGGLISYGADIEVAYRQMGVYVGRILKGEKPSDLPVQQPDRLELVINLKAAKALDLTVPQSLLALADETIE